MRGNQRGVWWPIEGEPRSGRGSLHAFSSQRVLSARGVLAITAQLGLVACLFAVIAAVLSVGPLRFDHALTGGVCALGSSGHKRTSVRTLRPTPNPPQGRLFRAVVLSMTRGASAGPGEVK